MEFKDYYATLGVPKTASERRNQARVSQAGAQVPPRPQSGRQGRRGEVQGGQRGQRGPGRSREAEEVRRARRQLARLRAARVPARRRAAVGDCRRPGRRDLPHDDAGRDAGDVRGRRSVLGFLPHVLRRRGRRRGRGGPAARAPTGPGSRVRASISRSKRRSAARRAGVDRHERRGAHGGRPHSRRREGRRARARRRRRRAAPGGATRRSRICTSASCPTPVRAARTGSVRARCPCPSPTAVLGGEVTVPTLSGSTLRLKMPELTPTAACSGCAGTACRRSASRTSAATCTRRWKSRSRRNSTPEERGTTRR